MRTALLVYGTRPEAIKIAPLIPALSAEGVRPVVAVTGQHREMLDQVNELFGIVPEHDLAVGRDRQSLPYVTTSVLTGVSDLLAEVAPDCMVVQGDTSSAMAAALAAFYQQIPVVHLEAGLRTGLRYSPFPEEMNRLLVSRLASLHLAPTESNARNLTNEGIPQADIVITGNTVIDALVQTANRRHGYSDPDLQRLLATYDRTVLITTHRRESWGEKMLGSLWGIRDVALAHQTTGFVLPVHRNPVVREVVHEVLGKLPNVLLTDPMDYGQFARLLSDCYFVMTDSGGIQEEAPSLGKPVLVLRNDTERPEAVEAGVARLVGTDRTVVADAASQLLNEPGEYAKMARGVNPYGDGDAAPRGAAAIAQLLGCGERLPDFVGAG